MRTRAISIPVSIGKGIAAWALRKSQFMNVAGQRCLRHFKSTATELASQFVLVCHQRVRYKFANRIVPLELHFLFSDKAKARLAIAATLA